MTTAAKTHTVACDSMQVPWDPQVRIVTLRYCPGTTLTNVHSSLLLGALRDWVGSSVEPFALLADATGVRGADAEYRSLTARFFKKHKDQLFIAVFNLGSLARLLLEMLRVGSGLQVRAFGDEAHARAWLREKGVAA